jgi:hypothetical protein
MITSAKQFEITYNVEWRTEGRKVRTRTTYDIKKIFEADNAEEAKAIFLAQPSGPTTLRKSVVRIRQIDGNE